MRGLRAKSIELLVYLAIHRDGVPLDQIIEAVWPGVPAQRAAQRLSTCLANLRTIIRAALPTTDPDAKAEPIVNTGGHYHLAPAIIDVDWWQLLDEQATTDTSAAALKEGWHLLADRCDYPWLDTDRTLVIIPSIVDDSAPLTTPLEEP